MYKRRVYLAIYKPEGKEKKLYSATTLKKLTDTLRLVLDIQINQSRVYDELRAPSVIYEEYTKGYELQIYKLVCA
jgi:hypothetical protein